VVTASGTEVSCCNLGASGGWPQWPVSPERCPHKSRSDRPTQSSGTPGIGRLKPFPDGEEHSWFRLAASVPEILFAVAATVPQRRLRTRYHCVLPAKQMSVASPSVTIQAWGIHDNHTDCASSLDGEDSLYTASRRRLYTGVRLNEFTLVSSSYNSIQSQCCDSPKSRQGQEKAVMK
jgi:hypothetical protein